MARLVADAKQQIQAAAREVAAQAVAAESRARLIAVVYAPEYFEMP